MKGARISPNSGLLRGVLGLLLCCCSVSSCAKPPVTTAAPAELQRRFWASNEALEIGVRGRLFGHLQLENDHLTLVVTDGQVLSDRWGVAMHLKVIVFRCPPQGGRAAQSEAQSLGPFQAAEPLAVPDSMVYTFQLPPGLDVTSSHLIFSLRGENTAGNTRGGEIWEEKALDGSSLVPSCRRGINLWYVEPSRVIPEG